MRRYLVALVLLVMVAAAWLRPLDQLAEQQAQSGLKRAVATFATARALNAVISVIQGTEVSAGVGLGMTLAPGQALDPLNDLIEKFSTLMLAASIAFGTQVLLIRIGAGWAMSLALTAVAAAWLWLWWRRSRPPPTLLTRALVALLLVRFIVPAVGLTSDLAYRWFMAEEYATSQKAIEQPTAALRGSDPVERGWRIADAVRIKEFAERILESAERTVEHAIRLSVVFLLQTMVLPLAAFWILLQAARALFVVHRPARGWPG